MAAMSSTAGTEFPAAAPGPGGTVPEWFPDWAQELAELYFSGTTSLFVLHGNVHDLVRCPRPDGDHFTGLTEFLATQVFGTWDVVLHHDLGRGLRALAGNDSQRLQEMLRLLIPRLGEPHSWPRDPEQMLHLLDRYLERGLVEPSADQRRSVALIFEYAQYLVPAGDLASLARAEGSRLVRFLGWAQNPYIKQANVAFCLIVDKLSEVNDRLVHNPHVATIQVPLPERAIREQFVVWAAAPESVERLTEFSAGQLADLTCGLNLVSLNVVLSQARQAGQRVDAKRFARLKKALIERQCQGLVEFVEPPFALDLVVGHAAAKARLEQDGRWIAAGRLETAPMGYLVSGPVGTGKTFLAECFAGTIRIPCVKLRNFRSKYVGETEGNLEQVLSVLRSLGPVIVIIDEADAALGSRQADGDSGTSGRVFSMIASQMGDTRYRGRIIWMLLTCRPDLLPIDLKRQGRAEVHIPLLYPESGDEMAEMIRSMAKKNKVRLAEGAIPELSPQRHLSGADLESIVLSAQRDALLAGRSQVERADLEAALADFLPSTQGLEKELQELAAVLECTELEFLPDAWRQRVLAPGGRAGLQERLVAIRQLLSS